MKARYCHRITLAALWKLRKEAEEETLQSLDDENVWLSEMKAKSATFYFWDLVMQVEVILLFFVRAHREGNFELYVGALERFMPFFFALDHTHYSRWASVHLQNKRARPEEIRHEFIGQKNWVVHKDQCTILNPSYQSVSRAKQQRLKMGWRNHRLQNLTLRKDGLSVDRK